MTGATASRRRCIRFGRRECVGTTFTFGVMITVLDAIVMQMMFTVWTV